MFDLAVAPNHVTHQTGQMVTVASDPRYCPVNLRGRQQYLDQFQSSALVAKKPGREIVKRVQIRYKPLNKEDYTPEQAAEVAREFIPELQQFEQQLEMSKAKAFTGTVNSLKFRSFPENSLAIWDDMVIDRTHPTRITLGEGPFKVVLGNEFQMSFNSGKTKAGHAVPANPRLTGRDSEFILLQDMIKERSVISAHSGYFLLKD